jgi:hypothetical protein
VIVVWTQYGWSWISSNPDVSPGIEATKNQRTRITLKPDEKFTGKLEMWSDMANRPRTFRLGFVPETQVPISGQKDIQERSVISWSNTLKLAR